MVGLLVGVGGAIWSACWCGRGCMVCLLVWEGLHGWSAC